MLWIYGGTPRTIRGASGDNTRRICHEAMFFVSTVRLTRPCTLVLGISRVPNVYLTTTFYITPLSRISSPELTLSELSVRLVDWVIVD